MLPPRDFKSLASTNFAIRAVLQVIIDGSSNSVLPAPGAGLAIALDVLSPATLVLPAHRTNFAIRAVFHVIIDGIYLNGFEVGGAGRNRTGVNGVAVRCMTTLPPRLYFQNYCLVRSRPKGRIHANSLKLLAPFGLRRYAPRR